MNRVILSTMILAVLGLVTRQWLVRQGWQGRVYFPLALLSISLWMFATAMFSACHGEVDWLHDPFSCAPSHPVAFNPQAWRAGR